MNQPVGHAQVAPAKTPEAGAVPRRGLSKRPKLIGLAAIAALVAGASGLAVAFRGDGDAEQLEPASDVPHRDGDAIVVSASFLESAGLATTVAVPKALTPRVRLVGAVEFDPTHVAAVGTRAAGIVKRVLHVEGDHVEKGDLLALIESPRLAEAHADLKVASAKERAARANAERERSLFARKLTTAREREEADSALAQQNALVRAARERIDALGGSPNLDPSASELRAPVSGVVAERAIAPGQSVGPGLIAFRVGDVNRLWVLLRIFERHLGQIRVGDRAEIRPLADPKVIIPGEVTHVGAVLDPATRTTDVRVAVADGERRLRPGQSVDATVLATAPARTALAVPTSAVTYVDGAPTVFVAEGATRFVPRRVELELEGGDFVEVTKGVREGERVVSKNVLAIKSELYR